MGPATNFVDVVALIGKKKSSGSGYDYIYINVNGQRVYGNSVSNPERFEGKSWTIPPLKEGLRAYLQPNPSGYGGKWGYINDKGTVVTPTRATHAKPTRATLAERSPSNLSPPNPLGLYPPPGTTTR